MSFLSKGIHLLLSINIWNLNGRGLNKIIKISSRKRFHCSVWNRKQLFRLLTTFCFLLLTLCDFQTTFFPIIVCLQGRHCWEFPTVSFVGKSSKFIICKLWKIKKLKNTFIKCELGNPNVVAKANSKSHKPLMGATSCNYRLIC